MILFRVTGMNCTACSLKVEKVVSNLKGVDSCSVNFLSGTMMIDGRAEPDTIVAAVRKAGYGADVINGSDSGCGENETEDDKEIKGNLTFDYQDLIGNEYEQTMYITFRGYDITIETDIPKLAFEPECSELE